MDETDQQLMRTLDKQGFTAGELVAGAVQDQSPVVAMRQPGTAGG